VFVKLKGLYISCSHLTIILKTFGILEVVAVCILDEGHPEFQTVGSNSRNHRLDGCMWKISIWKLTILCWIQSGQTCALVSRSSWSYLSPCGSSQSEFVMMIYAENIMSLIHSLTFSHPYQFIYNAAYGESKREFPFYPLVIKDGFTSVLVGLSRSKVPSSCFGMWRGCLESWNSKD